MVTSRLITRFASALAVVATVAAFATAAAARGSTVYMSCGNPPTSGAYGSFPAEISYVRHPSHCAYSEDGSTAHLVDLVGLRWRNWGGKVASARGEIVDNHDQDDNGFQRHRVSVWASRLRPAVGHRGTTKLYYTRLRVRGKIGHYRFSAVEKLFRPGEEPVVIPDY